MENRGGRSAEIDSVVDLTVPPIRLLNDGVEANHRSEGKEFWHCWSLLGVGVSESVEGSNGSFMRTSSPTVASDGYAEFHTRDVVESCDPGDFHAGRCIARIKNDFGMVKLLRILLVWREETAQVPGAVV